MAVGLEELARRQARVRDGDDPQASSANMPEAS
jgi:hypothetical protein